MQNANLALVTEHASASLPIVSVPSCRTCQSEYRLDVERALAEGKTYAAVARRFEHAGLSARNLAEHYRRGHLPIRHEAFRQLAEERAAQLNAVTVDGAASLVDRIVLLRAIVQRAYERLAVGEIEPELRDGIQAVRVLAELEPPMLRADERAFALDAFRNLLNAVKTVVGQDELDAIVNIARSDPAFQALTGRSGPAS